MKKKYLLFSFVLLFSVEYACAQVTIGDNVPPNENAVLDLVSGGNKGLILPRVKLVSSLQSDPMIAHVKGMVVYNTGSENLKEGFYFNTGQIWVPVADDNAVSWNSVTTGKGATSNGEDIYQMGAVGVGAMVITPGAKLEVTSSSAGVLLPRLSNTERDLLTAKASPGLLIYNSTSNCFEYSNAQQWVSLCGSYSPATVALISCDAPAGPTNSPKQGIALSSNNTYTVIINVSTIGAYRIVANTGNGYSYADNGTFLNTGTYTIVLKGQGTPQKAQTDVVSIEVNGAEATPTVCTLPTITVSPSATTFTVSCAATVNGTYLRNTSLTATNYVDIPVTGVTTPGTTIITTNTVNNIYFSSGSVSVAAGTSSIRLFAQGTPQNVSGSTPFSYQYTVGGTTCSFNVTVSTLVGTFESPAKSCLVILDEDPASVDGEYWINDGSGKPVKTFCDMTNGGYTLIASFSELTAFNGGPATGTNIYGYTNSMTTSGGNGFASADVPRNLITTKSGGPINYNDFRLNQAAMRNAKAAAVGKYIVRITNNATDMNDSWGINNYFEVNPTVGFDYIDNVNASCAESLIPSYGKMFGHVYDGRTNTPTYSGKVVSGDICPYVSYAGYNNHWDAGNRIAPANTLYNVIPGGQQFDAGAFNNLFGWWGETEINHHFGKCTSGGVGDDYNFTLKSCLYTNLRPHSFNGGQGRIMQWFVK